MVDVLAPFGPHPGGMATAAGPITERVSGVATWVRDRGQAGAPVPSARDVMAHYGPHVDVAATIDRFAWWRSSEFAVTEVGQVWAATETRARARYGTAGGAWWVLVVEIDPNTGWISSIEHQPDAATLELDAPTYLGSDCGPDVRAEVQQVFAAAMEGADLDYLRRSVDAARLVAVARIGGEAVGFHLESMFRVDLPGLPHQALRLAGLACVRPEWHRKGVATTLASAAWNRMTREGWMAQDEPVLSVSRYAHPGSWRLAEGAPGLVPRPGLAPSEWQREVATAAADVIGIEGFDPTTFVCRGTGHPPGRAIVQIEATPRHWELFGDVDRARGDTLLTLAWHPSPPTGWGT
jgi:hypothetical protein